MFAKRKGPGSVDRRIDKQVILWLLQKDGSQTKRRQTIISPFADKPKCNAEAVSASFLPLLARWAVFY